MHLYEGFIQFSVEEVPEVIGALLRSLGCEIEGWRREGGDLVEYVLCHAWSGEVEVELRVVRMPDGHTSVKVASYMKGV